MRHKRDIHRHSPFQSYLDRYPNHKKWINTCVCCQKSGYDPRMPQVVTIRYYGHSDHPTHIAKYIRYLYPPMAVDELGRCDECRNAMKKQINDMVVFDGGSAEDN